MKSCLHCKHAEWQKTAAGRLHPSGDGRCLYEYKVPVLPQSMYWCGSQSPTPGGGYISRKEKLKDHCAYWGPKA